MGFGLAALGFGGCAQSPQQMAAASPHGKEYFPSSIYGAASRRVVADGQPIPRGGGQYLVGKPYVVAGHVYVPSERRLVQVGNASWYGDAFHGRLTANGEIYDKNAFTAAHPTMPLPSYARVTNLRNNYSMIVRVNDRGPYASNRIMDVSGKVAEALDFKRTGTARIKVEYVARASLAGSDDAKLYATLRTDRPAPWDGEPTMVAQDRRQMPAVAEADTRHKRIAEPLSSGPPVDRRDPPSRMRAREEMATRDPPRGRPASHARPIEMASEHRLHLARLETPHLPIAELLPPTRPSRFETTSMARSTHGRMSRPLDLATIPGADSRITPPRRPSALRLARARDD